MGATHHFGRSVQFFEEKCSATWTLGKTLHRFVPNVKFSRLQRSLKKIHSEELDSGIFGLVI